MCPYWHDWRYHMRKWLLVLYMIVVKLSAYGNGLIDENILDGFLQRVGFNLYVGRQSKVTQRAEFASLTYDLSPDLSIILGSNITMPNQFHYVDMSIQNPWTLLSWNSSLELGMSHHRSENNAISEISQGVSFEYPLSNRLSIQLLLKRFTTAIYRLKGSVNLIALGIGMRV